MPTISVSGFNPEGGPSRLSAQATRDNLNEDHPAWALTLACDANNVTAAFTSATASDASLRAALEIAYPSASDRVV
ncbi:hypothetical protein WT27_31380 [Burkholderia territorii]|uniref:Uncharacterized protein n=1 Tax=Burkholderia territorii TaxID=1503055 RepID=A0A106E878_9BURK|nr:hypothetical protein [Burkholderia territorii]KVV51766.1 hypothetical protein WT27_31380 [Burkholderia territorii]KVX42861.1 hypothetical protein WT31_27355 [Burkholderia territorii]